MRKALSLLHDHHRRHPELARDTTQLCIAQMPALDEIVGIEQEPRNAGQAERILLDARSADLALNGIATAQRAEARLEIVLASDCPIAILAVQD